MWSFKSKFTVLRLKKGFIFVDSPLTLSYYILGPSTKKVSKVNDRKNIYLYTSKYDWKLIFLYGWTYKIVPIKIFREAKY